MLFHRQDKTCEVVDIGKSIFPKMPIYDKELYSNWIEIKSNNRLHITQEDILRNNKWGWFLTTETIRNLDKVTELYLINGYTGEKFHIDILLASDINRTIQTHTYFKEHNLLPGSDTVDDILNFFKEYNKNVVKILLPKYNKEFKEMSNILTDSLEHMCKDLYKDCSQIATYYIAWKMKDLLRELAFKLNFAYIYPKCFISGKTAYLSYMGITNRVCLTELVKSKEPKGEWGVCIYEDEVKICH